MRNFKEWFDNFVDKICTFDYYTNFDKVYKNIDNLKIELNILNSLIGSKNIENEFEELIKEYPQTLKCIPLLLAVRSNEMFVKDKDREYNFNFNHMNYSVEEYKYFMEKTGLFDLIKNKIISNLVDYATGVEVGLDSNARKNRGGHLMEDLVESYINQCGFVKDKTYFKELKTNKIQDLWDIDLSEITNNNKTQKRFDFVVKTDNMIYGIECNFYTGGGSKLNEVARSYKNIALESNKIEGFKFVWITDGSGWTSARHNLEETFEVLDDLYNINDMKNGMMKEIFI